MRMHSWPWRQGAIAAVAAGLVLAGWACKGSGGTDTGRDAVAEAATDPGTGPADDGGQFPDAEPDADASCDLFLAELPTDPPDVAPVDLPVDAEPEAIAEVSADADDPDATSPQGCDPLPAAGTLWALSAPDRETAAQVPMCTWRGDVVLIVNTAAS